MSEDNIIKVDFNPNARTVYTAIVRYDIPNSGMIQCAARNEEEARKLITEMSQGINNLEILDIFETKNAPELPQEAPEQDEPTNEGPETTQ